MSNRNSISLPGHPGTSIENNSVIPVVVLGGLGVLAASVLLGGHNSAPTVPKEQAPLYRSTAQALRALPAESFIGKHTRISVGKLDPTQQYAGASIDKDQYMKGQPFHLTVDNRDGKHDEYAVNPSDTYWVSKDTLSATSIQVGSPDTTSLEVSPFVYKPDSQDAKNTYAGQVVIHVPQGEHGDVYGLITGASATVHPLNKRV